MTMQQLSGNYRDAHIERFALGPHRDLTLFLQLDPASNPSIAQHAVVRFGAIVNYEEVAAFFSAMAASNAGGAPAEVRSLEHGAREGWGIDVAGYGKLSIMSARCIEKKR